MTGTPMSSVLSGIEAQLREIWATPAAPGEPMKSRVVTMNLVVVAGSLEVAERYRPVLDEVTQGTPARAILVALDPTASQASLEGDATAVCPVVPYGGPQVVCSELVRLVARGAACARVSSAVDALLVPEIPTVLVWLGRVHVDDPVFHDLAVDAQRVVLDTEYTSFSSLLSLARWAHGRRGRPHVADLSWTRLSTWQELTARFFDDPRLRAHAHRIDRLSITQASEAGAKVGPEASLFLGWLATRLQWKTEHLGGVLRFLRPDGGRVQVVLATVPRPTGVAPDALAAVAFEATEGGVHVRGSITRNLGSGRLGEPAGGLADSHPMTQTIDADVLTWRLEVDGAPPLEQTVRLGANRGARLLERTIHRPPQDAALEAAVAFADELYEDGLTAG